MQKYPELEPLDEIGRAMNLKCALPLCQSTKAEYLVWMDERQKFPVCAEHGEAIRFAKDAGARLFDPADPRAPKYWMHETSGVLRPAVEAYLRGEPLTAMQVGAMRAYLRQWINSPVWQGGEDLKQLRRDVESIRTREDISAWLQAGLAVGQDPL